MTPNKLVALALADTFLSREASLEGMIAAAQWALGQKWRWIASLCRFLHKRSGEHFYYYSRTELADIILEHRAFAQAFAHSPLPQIRRYCLERPLPVEPPAWLAALSLPALTTPGDLAQWFDVDVGELDWFADRWRQQSSTPQAMQHYHYRWLKKKSGGLRLIEIPKERLRAMQLKILRNVLDRVPLHTAAHGFRRGHSARSHAALHVNKRVVIRMDLKNFFTSISAATIHALFAKLGYAPSVAGILSRICTHRTPRRVLHAADGSAILPPPERMALQSRHLPQGSPCSPALANLCAYRLDIRLHALAQSLGASYSRYADDLVFSGDHALEQAANRLHIQVAAIALEEGFVINTRKTRIMPAGVRQQVTGIVVNRHANIGRQEYDLLKAILTNCVRHGAASQNRENREHYQAYLRGRVAYVQMVNPQRGMRLYQLFEKIVWPT